MVDQKKVDEIVRAVKEELKKNPEVSDKDFMDEFEASAADYARGIILPAGGKKKP